MGRWNVLQALQKCNVRARVRMAWPFVCNPLAWSEIAFVSITAIKRDHTSSPLAIYGPFCGPTAERGGQKNLLLSRKWCTTLLGWAT